jgi:hypothetical protein
MLFVDDDPPGGPTIVVMDFESGKEVFTRKLPIRTFIYGPPRFIPNSDRLFISTSTDPGERDDDSAKCLEIWRAADPPVLEKSIPGVAFDCPLSVTSNGRVAYAEATNIPYYNVYDVEQEKFLFVDPPRKERSPLKRWGWSGVYFGPGPPMLNRSGRRLYWPSESSLVDLDANRVIWSCGEHESCAGTNANDRFEVTEHWSRLWKNWLPNLDFRTRAIRKLETAELIYRTTEDVGEPPFYIRQTHLNKSETLVVDDEGVVHRLPMPLNWPLLGLCQLILATPMFLVAAISRRRRWRMRRAVVASAQ